MTRKNTTETTAGASLAPPATTGPTTLKVLKGGVTSPAADNGALTVAVLRAAVAALDGPDARDATAPVIDQWHRELQRDSLARAIRIGVALQARKEEQGHRGWLKWIDANLSLSRQQVAKYKRVADWWLKAEMESKLSILPATTFTGMVNALKKSKVTPSSPSPADRLTRRCMNARDLIHAGFEKLPRRGSQGRSEVLLGTLEHAVALLAEEVKRETLKPAELRERLEPLTAWLSQSPGPGTVDPIRVGTG